MTLLPVLPSRANEMCLGQALKISSLNDSSFARPSSVYQFLHGWWKHPALFLLILFLYSGVLVTNKQGYILFLSDLRFPEWISSEVGSEVCF